MWRTWTPSRRSASSSSVWARIRRCCVWTCDTAAFPPNWKRSCTQSQNTANCAPEESAWTRTSALGCSCRPRLRRKSPRSRPPARRTKTRARAKTTRPKKPISPRRTDAGLVGCCFITDMKWSQHHHFLDVVFPSQSQCPTERPIKSRRKPIASRFACANAILGFAFLPRFFVVQHELWSPNRREGGALMPAYLEAKTKLFCAPAPPLTTTMKTRSKTQLRSSGNRKS
mmetsp:Transcript_22558/g.57069  ORF Transcript_22558/g.57069 Transcript_22558/m.57069 type:complete len:228 (+) Transcript_22558:1847-2530(+)